MFGHGSFHRISVLSYINYTLFYRKKNHAFSVFIVYITFSVDNFTD